MSSDAEQAPTRATTSAPPEGGLLDQVIAETGIGRSPAQHEESRRQIATLVREVAQGNVRISKDLDSTIKTAVSDIDALLSRQLSEVMHAPEFQRLEAAWRGLRYLVDQTDTGPLLKLRALNVSKDDLREDMERAVEIDESALFKKLYVDSFEAFAGEPFAALIGDYEFGPEPREVGLLERIASVAAAAQAPFLAAASPRLFKLDSFTELGKPNLEKIFLTVEHAAWRSFRESEDARYVGLTLPHILMRLPYGRKTLQVEEFNFEEVIDSGNQSAFLWGNAAYAFATRLTDAFAKYSWPAAIRGVEGGGLVQGLPTYTFKTVDGDIALKSPTEIAISDRCEAELSKLGFIAPVHRTGTDFATFLTAQSCQKAATYDADVANAAAGFWTQLPYVLVASRFAHYLQVMMRDRIGSITSKEQREAFLNNWISQYVSVDDNASQDERAQRPLRAARIEIVEIPGRPGAYQAVTYLTPHYQLETPPAAARIVVTLRSLTK